MTWLGKLIGFCIGAWLAGPIGALIGLFIGHLVDKGRHGPQFRAGFKHAEAQQAFFETTFAVMGHIAKADGRVSESEIEVARKIMKRIGLNEQQKNQAIHQFNKGKQPDFNLYANLRFMKQACQGQRNLLRMFLEIQLQAAYADSIASDTQQEILQDICQQLGMARLNFTLLNLAYGRRAQSNGGYRQQHQHQQGFRSQSTPLKECYAVLEIKSSATNQEVKRAYRRLMSQNHPDKLVAKGLPEEMVKLATEKTQRIRKAYEQICRARKMK